MKYSTGFAIKGTGRRYAVPAPCHTLSFFGERVAESRKINEKNFEAEGRLCHASRDISVGQYAPDGFVPSFQPYHRHAGLAKPRPVGQKRNTERDSRLCRRGASQAGKDGRTEPRRKPPSPARRFTCLPRTEPRSAGGMLPTATGKSPFPWSRANTTLKNPPRLPVLPSIPTRRANSLPAILSSSPGRKRKRWLSPPTISGCKGRSRCKSWLKMPMVRPSRTSRKRRNLSLPSLFPDGGAYSYSIDGGEPQELTSGGTLTLKHGQSAVFEQIPVGVTYTVTEQPMPGYTMSGTGHTGTITEAGSAARFTNTYTPSQTGSLTVSKEVVDASPDGSADIAQGIYLYRCDKRGDGNLRARSMVKAKPSPICRLGRLTPSPKPTTRRKDMPPQCRNIPGRSPGRKNCACPSSTSTSPRCESGSLTVSKEVVGDNPEPDKEFAFAITFSDGGTYEYTVDGGEPQELTSGGILVLKGGQTGNICKPAGRYHLHRERNRHGGVSPGG